MKYASEDLVHEHEGILFGLNILEAMTKRIESGQDIDIDDAGGMIRFLKLFADKCHHGKEEGLLFPALVKSGLRHDGGPVGQMLAEHAAGRGYIAEMSACTEGDFDRDGFTGAARNYIGLLREHISKENTVLFPYSDRTLPPGEQERLLEQFEIFEEQVMGKGTHEKLHELLGRLESKYL